MTDHDGDGPSAPLALVAYALPGADSDDLVAAPATRAWMDAAPRAFANRCLPLLVANAAGWLLLNPVRVSLVWDGTRGLDGVRVTADDGPRQCPVGSHFGQGIATWTVPFLFRTPPGWDLLVRGPANCPKDGVYPLEGLVETDWASATFTMNWHLTRPGLDVVFEVGEPFAMLVPQRRDELERFHPRVESMASAPDTARAHGLWAASRSAFNRELARGSVPAGPGWQRHYFQGRNADGSAAPEHRTRRNLRDFLQAPERSP